MLTDFFKAFFKVEIILPILIVTMIITAIGSITYKSIYYDHLIVTTIVCTDDDGNEVVNRTIKNSRYSNLQTEIHVPRDLLCITIVDNVWELEEDNK